MIKRTPKEHVINFYLSASLEEINALQETLREIYRHRVNKHQTAQQRGQKAHEVGAAPKQQAHAPTPAKKAAPKHKSKKPAPAPMSGVEATPLVPV